MAEKENQTNHSNQHLKIKRRKLLLILTLFFSSVGLIFLIYWLFIGQYHETTDDAYVSGNQIEIMSQISGRVVKIRADETDLVTKGEPIIELDKADAEVVLKNAEAHLALTVRQVSQLYQNVDQLKANVAQQESNLEKAQEDLQRRQGLKITEEISIEDLRHAKLAVDNATAALNLVKDQLAAAINLVANSDLYHHPQVLQAKEEVRNAYLSWYRTIIYSPATGYVAKRTVQVGQEISPNVALMIVVPLDQIWVNANFKETQLRHIRIGQPAIVYSDLYGGDVKYNGKVVGLNAGTGSSFDLLPPQNATGNWIKIVQRLPVRISLDANELQKHPLRIGLSTTVTVYTRHRKGAVLSFLPTNKVLYQAPDDADALKKADEIVDKILQDNAKNISYSTQ